MDNPGKKFQDDFRDSMKNFSDLSVDRFHDPMGGQKGLSNICDFMVYYYPYLFYFELKSYKGNTIPLDAVRQTQYEGLLKKIPVPGVVPGLLLNYRNAKTGEEKAVFLHIGFYHELLASGAKSISLDYALAHGSVMPSTKRRTHYDYEVMDFLNRIRIAYGGDFVDRQCWRELTPIGSDKKGPNTKRSKG